MAEQLMLVNPRKRRKSRRKSIARRPAKRRVSRRRSLAKLAPRRRRRSNPNGGPMTAQIMNAATGAAGALAVDLAMAQLPLPEQLTATPAMRAATQGGVSLMIGMLVANFGKKRKLGRQLAEGGLTVALHGVGKGLIGPTMGLSAYDDSLLGDSTLLGGMGAWHSPGPVSPGPGMSSYVDGGMGTYEENDNINFW